MTHSALEDITAISAMLWLAIAIQSRQYISPHSGQVLMQASSGNEFLFSLLVRRRVCNGHVPQCSLHNEVYIGNGYLEDTWLLESGSKHHQAQEEPENGRTADATWRERPKHSPVQDRSLMWPPSRSTLGGQL